MARIAVTDGLSAEAQTLLEKRGHEIVVQYYQPEELAAGVLDDFDAVIVRSATKLSAEVIALSLIHI